MWQRKRWSKTGEDRGLREIKCSKEITGNKTVVTKKTEKEEEEVREREEGRKVITGDIIIRYGCEKVQVIGGGGRKGEREEMG